MYTKIELEEAIQIIEENVQRLPVAYVELNDALGHILAEDIVAPFDQPPFDRSPLDGYAVCSQDLLEASQDYPVYLRIVDTVYAGQEAKKEIHYSQAVKITTGAMLPKGCDCVIRQEDAKRDRDFVCFYKPAGRYENYCFKGEDFKKGQTLLKKGIRLDAAALSVLASAGISRNIPVYISPSIAVVCTGSEVVSPSVSVLPVGKIYGTNETYLMARLKEMGIKNIHCAYVPDEPEEASQMMSDLLETYDMLITTGGVSVGDKDIMHEVLPIMKAEQIFWRVLLKPGSPVMFSKWHGKPILSLSGNPFAAAATFELFGRALIHFMAGDASYLPKKMTGILENEFDKSSKGRRFIRGRFEDGKVWLPNAHESGIMSSFVGCNCLVDIPAGTPALQSGNEVNLILL